MNIVTTKYQPKNSDAWNELCLINNNLLQTTYYDDIRVLFNQYPVYFEVFDGNNLVGGVKAYEYRSNKLPFISKISSTLRIIGEVIKAIDAELPIEAINNNLIDYISHNNITQFKSMGYYGGFEDIAMIHLKKKNTIVSPFDVAAFDLSENKDVLWKKNKESHKRNINKALKASVNLIESDDLDHFITLLNETYALQKKSAPNASFIKRIYNVLYPKGLLKIFFAEHNSIYYGSALVTQFGNYADYSFGGNLKNNFGAGHFLHWSIALTYQQKNYSRYILGQVAKNDGNYGDNTKFVDGISRFKREFSTFNLPSSSIEWTINPLKLKTWQLIQKLAGL